jgi:hypothetical protein
MVDFKTLLGWIYQQIGQTVNNVNNNHRIDLDHSVRIQHTEEKFEPKRRQQIRVRRRNQERYHAKRSACCEQNPYAASSHVRNNLLHILHKLGDIICD